MSNRWVQLWMRKRRAELVAGRQREWQQLAARLELTPAPERAEALRVLLNLPAQAAVAPVYRSCLGAQRGYLYLFEASEPGPKVTSACALLLAEPAWSLGLKVSGKRSAKLAQLAASAAGGEVLSFADDPEFEAVATVIARDVAGAYALLSAPVRRRLKAALSERGCAPLFLLGERQLVFVLTGAAPAPLGCLEQLSVDLLGLYAALS